MLPLMYFGIPIFWSWVLVEIIAVSVLLMFPFLFPLVWQEFSASLFLNPIFLAISIFSFLIVYLFGQTVLKKFWGEKQVKLF